VAVRVAVVESQLEIVRFDAVVSEAPAKTAVTDPATCIVQSSPRRDFYSTKASIIRRARDGSLHGFLFTLSLSLVLQLLSELATLPLYSTAS
jgi:hypothetical protein